MPGACLADFFGLTYTSTMLAPPLSRRARSNEASRFGYSLSTPAITLEGPARLWLPDLVSTAHSEVRITFSPAGQRMLWGAIGWPPVLSPDGRQLLFAADERGGAGKHADASASCDLTARTAPNDTRCAQQWLDENLGINDVLSFGTHNSYKQAIPEPEYAILRTRAKDGAVGLDYSHRPLREQLDDGARQLELDVYYDPKGGRFANPALPRLIGGFAPEGKRNPEGIPRETGGFAPEGKRSPEGIPRETGKQLDTSDTAALSQPGFKVMHVPDVDFRSSCVAFVECLRSVKAWSEAHPRHIPLLILINAKDDPSPAQDGAAVLKFDTAAFDALDAEIASVFARDDLITPDQVQGKYATLREAVLAGSWPKLRAARGKVMFALDDNPRKVAAYRAQRRSLEGRLMFVNTEESSPAAAYLTLNEPVADAPRIRAAVTAGFIVRTRADADTVEARSGSVTRRDTALASGAQYISTDYMRPDPRFSTYSARLPGGATAICNPVRTEKRCGKHAIAE